MSGTPAGPSDNPATTRSRIIASLRRAGCVAAEEEADELIGAADTASQLERMVTRRTDGEPLAWITGRAVFCGRHVIIEPGVYVPRWQSETLARLAARLLPASGCGVDLCTGSGAVALVLQAARPGATVVATEIDPVAVGCARRNGVAVYPGDLDRALPAALTSRVDVITGVLPYVPTEALHLLPRDVQQFEPRRALDGGPGGLGLVARAITAGPRWLRLGGWLLLEVGSDQIDVVSKTFTASGFDEVAVIEDGDGDARGVFGRMASTSGAVRSISDGSVDEGHEPPGQASPHLRL